MTENVIQPERSCGRPKKYYNDEDKRLAYNRQIKECLLRNPFHHDICDHMYHMSSKSKHLRSNKHMKNLQIMLNNYGYLSYLGVFCTIKIT